MEAPIGRGADKSSAVDVVSKLSVGTREVAFTFGRGRSRARLR